MCNTPLNIVDMYIAHYYDLIVQLALLKFINELSVLYY
jgi:hypothetical protein